ncbi:hypothetical protein L0Z72_01270 [candidate division KSB1 bacterium]|nr:hypothetical protein [candidate division KSB1 bacterium]
MICYSITKPELEALIENEKPGWLEKAKERTEKFRQQGNYEESSSIWSDVKPVYMSLQGESKCAYCERKLESSDYGKIEQDVEHFRPKKMVREWKIPKRLKNLGITATERPDKDNGYYLLPYHPLNYAATCKPCNSVLKKNYFPIAGDYDLNGEDPVDLLKEKPFLIYPIGNFDEAPEKLIGFHGVSPQAIANQGHERARALVTIEFFKLDDLAKRKNLIRERAVIIIALYPQLKKIADDVAEEDSQKIIDGFIATKAPHTNCARSFKRLFESDPNEARAVFDLAVQLIVSTS